MSVWDHLDDPDEMARLLQHPAHRAVTGTVSTLITDLRTTSTREQLRGVQETLAAALTEAETRYREQSRLSKRGRGDPTDLTFWRRACFQLRAVGDGIAWRFLGYRPLPADVIEWRSPTGRGVVHASAMEQLAIELTAPTAWASALATTVPPGGQGRWGIYTCLADEQKVWA